MRRKHHREWRPALCLGPTWWYHRKPAKTYWLWLWPSFFDPWNCGFSWKTAWIWGKVDAMSFWAFQAGPPGPPQAQAGRPHLGKCQEDAESSTNANDFHDDSSFSLPVFRITNHKAFYFIFCYCPTFVDMKTDPSNMGFKRPSPEHELGKLAQGLHDSSYATQFECGGQVPGPPKKPSNVSVAGYCPGNRGKPFPIIRKSSEKVLEIPAVPCIAVIYMIRGKKTWGPVEVPADLWDHSTGCVVMWSLKSFNITQHFLKVSSDFDDFNKAHIITITTNVLITAVVHHQISRHFLRISFLTVGKRLISNCCLAEKPATCSRKAIETNGLARFFSPRLGHTHTISGSQSSEREVWINWHLGGVHEDIFWKYICTKPVELWTLTFQTCSWLMTSVWWFTNFLAGGTLQLYMYTLNANGHVELLSHQKEVTRLLGAAIPRLQTIVFFHSHSLAVVKSAGGAHARSSFEHFGLGNGSDRCLALFWVLKIYSTMHTLNCGKWVGHGNGPLRVFSV